MTTVDTTRHAFEADWQQWHRDRERYFADPLGWISITGLYWLTEDFAEIADIPGRWRADTGAVFVEGIEGTERLEPVEGAPGLLLDIAGRRIEVIRRTGSAALRVHDPKSPDLQRYTGIPTYPPDERWRVRGSFTAYERPQSLTTDAVVPGLEHHHSAVGVIDFDLRGAAQRLIAFARRGDDLQILFTDPTSGVTTYAGCRGLSVSAPAQDGTVILDFNRAVNLPCAFTDYATCPVAPPENKLSVAVEAGEMIPR